MHGVTMKFNCVSGSDYTASNKRMTSQWTGKDWERSGRGLIGSTLGMCEGMRKSTRHLTAVNIRTVSGMRCRTF